ncbi:hypothetical protein PYCCODRAFT_338436 [Trametes coccinea BRFM310]|uniref:Uncharacterized protein n=1 Tax=Trametes coccinea (strain BRFM310) TaxID=1353009 RepID=A0A1Y2J2M9_TRAC3|nr:hypothetical protein PYCCODRAFT_338436 [Trametes coccinea BRFM310]
MSSRSIALSRIPHRIMPGATCTSLTQSVNAMLLRMPNETVKGVTAIMMSEAPAISIRRRRSSIEDCCMEHPGQGRKAFSATPYIALPPSPLNTRPPTPPSSSPNPWQDTGMRFAGGGPSQVRPSIPVKFAASSTTWSKAMSRFWRAQHLYAEPRAESNANEWCVQPNEQRVAQRRTGRNVRMRYLV